MAGFGDVVKKAFYLGVGVASYAGEKAGDTLKDLREQSQTLVNELVARGEITAEEAQRLVNDMVNRAQNTTASSASATDNLPQPRPIEILDDDTPSPVDTQTEALRNQVAALRQELENLKRKSSN
ncbi:phasin family protein [Nodosilinea sp. AN01ver1]|uniref:phasin family protein n=1 Tax=Nodosilinea sp. AN01ver1 TaxID=3423362 RepID=UPI003D316C37